MKTLIVFDTLDGIEFYLIPHFFASQYSTLLKEANGKMINLHNMNDGMKFINAAKPNGSTTKTPSI